MANSAPVRSDYTALTQDVLHESMVDFTQQQFPLAALIIAKDPQDAKVGKQSFGTKALAGGRLSRVPGFLAGKRLMPMDRAKIQNAETFMPLIQTGLPTDNGKTMDVASTTPEKTDWDTDTPMSRFQRPYTRWFDKMWPISIPRWETLLAKGGGAGNAAAALVDISAKEARDTARVAISYYNSMLWNPASAPSNQEARKHDSLYSIHNICGEANRFMGIDRSLAANAYFRGNTDATAKPKSLKALLDDYRFTGAAVSQYGMEQDDVFAFCNPSLFTTFRDEAKSNGAMQITSASQDYAKAGFKFDIVQYEPGLWLVNDFTCPANTVAFLRPDTFYVAFHQADNWRVAPFKYAGEIAGGNDAMESYLRVNMMMGCVAPCLNAIYTNVTA
jgi:hypothetical protein